MIFFNKMIFPKDENVSLMCKEYISNFISNSINSVISMFSAYLINCEDFEDSIELLNVLFPKQFDLPESYLPLITNLLEKNASPYDEPIDVMQHYLLREILKNTHVYGANKAEISTIKMPNDLRKLVKTSLMLDLKEDPENKDKNSTEIIDAAESIIKTYENFMQYTKYISGENPDWLNTVWYWNNDTKSNLLKERLNIDTTYIDLIKEYNNLDNEDF